MKPYLLVAGTASKSITVVSDLYDRKIACLSIKHIQMLKALLIYGMESGNTLIVFTSF
jgi:hypothetical protein